MFAGGGWSEELKRGVIMKGVCVAEGLCDTSTRLFEDGGGGICCCRCD